MNPTPSSSPIHALLHEKLDALLADSELVMDNAQHGHIIDDLDDFLLVEGKKFIREVFQQKLQERAERIEQAEETQQCKHCQKKRQVATNAPKPSPPPIIM